LDEIREKYSAIDKKEASKSNIREKYSVNPLKIR